jgi:RHS repeat-associated protein
LGGVTQSVYDSNDNILSRTDANSHTTTYQYDTQNRLINATDPLGNVSSTTYDPAGNRLSTTDANGHTTIYQYDSLNRRIAETDPLGNTTTYQYSSIGGPPCCGATAGSDLLTGTIDGDGKHTYYHYDELNRRVQVVHKSGTITDTNTPSDAITTTTYDAENNHIAVTDPNGNTTTMGYDALNRQITMTNAGGDMSTTAYDPAGNIIQTVDPRGNVTTYTYDAVNRLTQKTDSIGPVLTDSYDPVGNIISTTDGNGNVTTTTYDAINRHIAVTDPLGRTTTTAYDPVGNVLSSTDRNGNTTTYTYDADNRKISTTDALGNTSATVYDPAGNVSSATDALGHTTTYTYDADNRRIQETYPDTPSDTRTYTYDGTGHLSTRLDQNGRTTTYQYNDFYYMTNRQYSVGSNDLYSYDLGGRLTDATRGTWTDTYTYDGANRVITSVQNGQTVAYVYIIPSGIRTITYPGGSIVTESNDLRSRLVQVNDGGFPPLTQYTYDLNNSVLTRTNRNGTLSTYTYDANNWVTDLTHSNASSLIAGYAYAYDNEGNKIYETNQGAPSESETYSYDALYRLTNYDVGIMSGGIIPSPSIAESYNLDAVGNWTSFISNSATQTRTHNAVNEITTTNGGPLTYDANGNLTNDGQYTYAYDVENRVTAVTRDSDSAVVGQYFYDARGCRVISIINPAGTPATNVYFLDNSRILEEQNSGGITQATYTYGSYVDEVVTMKRGGHLYYYHPNELFSVEALTDSSGTAVERYYYDAYGEPVVMDGSYNPLPLNAWGTPHSAVGNSYLFTGRQLDEESGIYYYRARYYDPAEGRFIQRDPLDYVDGPNLYEYVRSEPTRLTDPTGLHYIAGSLTLSCPVKCNGETIGALQANRDLFYHTSRQGAIGYAIRNANGVGIAIDFKSAVTVVRRPCCCKRFRYLQIVRTNQGRGRTGDQSYVDVDTENTTPFYDDGGRHGIGSHRRPPKYMGAGTIVDTDISMYDTPYRADSALRGLREDFTWRAESCLVCVKDRPAKDVILQCMTYGFNRNRNENGTFGPAWGVGPECGEAGGSANFRQTVNAWNGGAYKAGEQYE